VILGVLTLSDDKQKKQDITNRKAHIRIFENAFLDKEL
jgi:hypothetical protein